MKETTQRNLPFSSEITDPNIYLSLIIELLTLTLKLPLKETSSHAKPS